MDAETFAWAVTIGFFVFFFAILLITKPWKKNDEDEN